MRRNLIALAVTVTLAAGATSAYAETTTTYNDISGNWAQSDISNLVEHNVMTGFNDGKFHPDAWVTRTEFSNMAAKTVGLAPQQAETVPGFRLVARNQMGFDTVDNQALISAYPTDVFRPANPVRRVEVLSGLAGAINKPLVSEAEAEKILSKYTDAAQIPANARLQVATAIKYDLFEVDPKAGENLIDPLRPATRAEVAAMLNNLYENQSIALVQDGKLVSQGNQTISQTTEQQTTTETSANTQTQGTSAASGYYSSVNTTEAQSTTSAEAGSSTTLAQAGGTTTQGQMGTDANAQQQTNQAQTETDRNWLRTEGAPFRNSADTIREFRAVNTTTAPSNLDANMSVTLAPNTTFTGTLAKALFSEFNREGDPVMVILDHAIMDSTGRVIAPAGSRVLGTVSEVRSNNVTQDKAKLGINFTGIMTPTGQRIPIRATVNNTDGILTAGELQGVVFHPFHSTAALEREINTASGAMYGTMQGKAYVLDQPQVTQTSARPITPLDITSGDGIILGVGDKLQLRLESVGAAAIPETETND